MCSLTWSISFSITFLEYFFRVINESNNAPTIEPPSDDNLPFAPPNNDLDMEVENFVHLPKFRASYGETKMYEILLEMRASIETLKISMEVLKKAVAVLSSTYSNIKNINVRKILFVQACS